MSKNIDNLRSYLRNLNLASLSRDLLINKVNLLCYIAFQHGMKYGVENPNASKEILEVEGEELRLRKTARIFEPEEMNKPTTNSERKNR